MSKKQISKTVKIIKDPTGAVPLGGQMPTSRNPPPPPIKSPKNK